MVRFEEKIISKLSKKAIYLSLVFRWYFYDLTTWTESQMKLFQKMDVKNKIYNSYRIKMQNLDTKLIKSNPGPNKSDFSKCGKSLSEKHAKS